MLIVFMSIKEMIESLCVWISWNAWRL